MPSRLYSFLVYIGTVALIGAVLYLVFMFRPEHVTINIQPSNAALTAAAGQTLPATTATSTIRIPHSSSASVSSSATASTTKGISVLPSSKVRTSAPIAKTITAAVPTTSQATRIQNPYSTAPESSETINTEARASLVNIICMQRSGGSSEPISGSGVIIDSRGVILTNAHVAQYVFLSENPNIDLKCVIRTGSPAMIQWSADVLYLPPVWVQAHASELNISHVTGTGEHDYALLRITSSASNIPLPSIFPSTAYDTRNAIGFFGDSVLGASYPAEFLGGIQAENNLYSVSSISPIHQLLTFATSSVDAIDIGGVIEAQSGSSGGGVWNSWGRLIGLITTTSVATTTAGRDLRAITISYINSDILKQTGSDLSGYLSGDITATEANFNANLAPNLMKQYLQLLGQN